MKRLLFIIVLPTMIYSQNNLNNWMRAYSVDFMNQIVNRKFEYGPALSIAFIYKKSEESQERFTIQKAKDAFYNVSKNYSYIKFIEIGIDGNAQQFAKELNLKNLPVYILFKDGKPLLASLTGYANSSKITDFINRNFSKDIKSIESKLPKKRRIQTIYRQYTPTYPPPNYYDFGLPFHRYDFGLYSYPYWGYHYYQYYSRPGFGFYFGL